VTARDHVGRGGDLVFGQPVGRRTGTATSGAEPALEIPGMAVPGPPGDERAAEAMLRTGRYFGDMGRFRQRSAGYETIIGDDDRHEVSATLAYPFRMICSLVMRWPGGFESAGTGFLIGQRTVITAGHCLLPRAGHPLPEEILVKPARAGQNEPFAGQFPNLFGERVSLHPRWSNGFDPRFDVGALQLGRAIGETTGWFRVGVRGADELERHWAHVTGYPGDKVVSLASGETLPAAAQYHHATPIETVHDARVYYPADTFGGQSGAPVYIIEADGRATVVGVHAYGTGADDASGGLAFENNSAAWIDAPMLQVLSDWRNLP